VAEVVERVHRLNPIQERSARAMFGSWSPFPGIRPVPIYRRKSCLTFSCHCRSLVPFVERVIRSKFATFATCWAGRGETWSVRGHVRWPVTPAADRFRPSTFTSARGDMPAKQTAANTDAQHTAVSAMIVTERPVIGFQARFPAGPDQCCVLGAGSQFCGRAATATVKGQ